MREFKPNIVCIICAQRIYETSLKAAPPDKEVMGSFHKKRKTMR